MATAPKLKVLITHREPVIAAGLRATLLRQKEFEVSPPLSAGVDLAQSGHEFADVILTDCETGIRLARAMQSIKTTSRPCIVIVTQDEREVSIRSAIDGGVRGYLFLHATPNFIVQAVRNAARGGTVMDPLAATKMVDSLSRGSITHRELQVLRLVMQGSPNKTIAARLGIAIGTVKCHLKRLFAKLDAKSRAELAAIARTRGLIATVVPGECDNATGGTEVRERLVDVRSAHPSRRGAMLSLASALR